MAINHFGIFGWAPKKTLFRDTPPRYRHDHAPPPKTTIPGPEPAPTSSQRVLGIKVGLGVVAGGGL